MARPAPFSVAVELGSAGLAVVRLGGELDIAGDSELRRTLLGLMADGKALALEISALRFCDVPGARALIDMARIAAERGVPFEIRGASGQVGRLLRLLDPRGVLPLAG